MSPKVGVPYVTEQVGILNTSKKQALLKEFVDWFGSSELQKNGLINLVQFQLIKKL